MKTYKHILIFSIIWVLLFFIIEYIMNIVFDDKIPFWKLAAIGLISGVGTAYPIFRKNKNFTLDKIRKKQVRYITIDAYDNQALIESIVERLRVKRFKIKKYEPHKISLRSKIRRESFGENYEIYVHPNEIIVKSVVRFNVFPWDEGQRYRQINIIESEILEACKNSGYLKN